MAKTPRHSRPEANDANSRARRANAPTTDPRRGRHAQVAPPKQSGKRTIVAVVAAMLALCVVGAIAWFFLLSDSDADKIQGVWRVPQTQATVTITDSEIVLAQDVSYDYSIDPLNHTMDLAFFGAHGSAAYALTNGGDMLTITESLVGKDGESYVQTLVLVRQGSQAEEEYLEELALASGSGNAAGTGPAGSADGSAGNADGTDGGEGAQGDAKEGADALLDGQGGQP